MFRENKQGFHTKLTPEIIEIIISNVKGNYTPNQVARVSMIPQTTLSDWLRRGKEDAKNETQSIFAQLSLKFEAERGKEIMEMLSDVRKRKNRWQACWELVKAIAKDEFGIDATDMKAVEELITSLLNRVEKMEKSHGA